MKRIRTPSPGNVPRGGYFAQRPVRPGELPSIMRKHIFTGIPRIKVMDTVREDEEPFLLPLFFEEVPGINRIRRLRRRKDSRR